MSSVLYKPMIDSARALHPEGRLRARRNHRHYTLRGFDAGLCQSLRVTYGEVLNAAVAVMNQTSIAFNLTVVQRLLECIECQVRLQ